MGEPWRVDDVRGVVILRCEALLEIPGLAHAFSTRCADGRDDFDLGSAAESDPSVLERRGRFLRAAGLPDVSPFVLQQVHGAEIVAAASTGGGVAADGAWWKLDEDPTAVPAVRTADCVAILLADSHGGIAVAVHAGWRGTAAGIPHQAVRKLASLGSAPGDLVAALGPAIGPCCYEVGGEVEEAVRAADPDGVAPGRPAEPGGRFHLDLRAAVARQLEAVGVRPERTRVAPWCTRCHGERFFSFRREGKAAGRLMAAVGASRASLTAPPR
jgi:YfiH family protein